jgi:hypothetical protein
VKTTFTLDEANAMLPIVTPLLEQLRAAQAVIAEEHEVLAERAPGNGGGVEGRDFLDSVSASGLAIAKLNEVGVVVRDPAGGLIDFPSERDGEPIYLCWRLGEERVAWWHPTTSGFADRRPL